MELSKVLITKEKIAFSFQNLKILEQKYDMRMTRELEGGISSMCNVGEGLVERTLERGIQQGIQQVIGSLIKTARKYGATDEEIVEQLVEEFQLDKTVAEEYLAANS